jgi:raffinose/stachyose/melibiose transport system substrate-binding protein
VTDRHVLGSARSGTPLSRRGFFGLAGAVAATAALPLSGCSSGSGSRTSIQFKQNKPEVVEYFGNLVDQFNSSQNAVRVVHDSTPTSIIAQFVRGAPPDVGLYNYQLEAAEYVEKGVLSNLADLPAAQTIDPTYQSLVGQFAAYQGQTNVLPYSVTAAGVIYNKKLFADNGVAVPTRFSELVAACKTFEAAKVTPLYGTYKDTWTQSQGIFDYSIGGAIDVADFFERLRAEGGDDLADAPVSFAKDMREPVERMFELAGYANPNAVTRGYSDGNLAFGEGTVAMYLQGPWALGEIEKVGPDFEVGTFPLPMTEDPADLRVRVNLDLGLWIPQGLSAQRRAAAREFASFLLRPEVVNDYNQKNLATSPLRDAPTQSDARLAGLQPSIEAGRVYQGPGTYIPMAIPLASYLQGVLPDGDADDFLRTLDDDWQRLAARSA